MYVCVGGVSWLNICVGVACMHVHVWERMSCLSISLYDGSMGLSVCMLEVGKKCVSVSLCVVGFGGGGMGGAYLSVCELRAEALVVGKKL